MIEAPWLADQKTTKYISMFFIPNKSNFDQNGKKRNLVAQPERAVT
jgi:hypothetical protein